MKKILVVGGCGYIGGYTTDLLLKNGCEVTVYDNLLYEDRFLKDVNFIRGDIRNTKLLIKTANNHDVIVLLAALVGDPACSVDQDLTNEINYLAIKAFCDGVNNDKHIIFMSTCSVYGAQDGLLNEESTTNPLSTYASTKLKSEKHIIKKNGTVFRLGTVFGLGDNHSRIRMDLVVNVLTMRAITFNEITINGGEQWRPIISVIDIANYILESCLKGHRGVYVLSKENVIIKELGEKVANLIPGTKVNYTEISFQDARNYKVDNNKSLKTFEYKPQITVEDEVLRIKNLIDENRIKDPMQQVYHNGNFLRDLKEKKLFK
jgi:nucleoside-diphosphate-sugar epimerase